MASVEDTTAAAFPLPAGSTQEPAVPSNPAPAETPAVPIPESAAATPAQVVAVPETASMPAQVVAVPVVREPESLAEWGPSDFVVDLTPSQEKALRAMKEGKGLIQAAKAAGVCRGTLYNWQRYDRNFIAAQNVWRLQCQQEVDNRIAAMRDKALRTLSDALDKGDIRAAKLVLEHLQRQQVGPGDPKGVDTLLERRARRAAQRAQDAFRIDRYLDRRPEPRPTPTPAAPKTSSLRDDIRAIDNIFRNLTPPNETRTAKNSP